MPAGGFLLSASLALAQAVRQDTSATPDTTAKPIPVVAQSPDNVAVDDDVVMMTPFQVDATKDKGYFAENTLAGSRMRTNIADLGAAISVVTKQQLEDTASLDINDIFRYEIGTEGSTTYTPFVFNASRADGVFESIGGNNIGGAMTTSSNATSNRIRGLGSPSVGINYYQALTQVPFDSYNAASFEINRGPNSLLFGMGSPAGIVNQSTAQAQINQNTAQLMMRVDDRGSLRAGFSFNKTLIKNKLAIYGSLLYNDQEFERKPSYDITRRQYGAITYKPFRTTTLRATVEGYSNDNRRPNSLSPVDGVSEWRNAKLADGTPAGMPVYDAQTRSFVSLATGKTIAKFANTSSSPDAQAVRDFVKSLPGYNSANWKKADGTVDTTQSSYNGVSIFGADAITKTNSILYVPGASTYNARTIMQIADSNIQRWFQPLGGNRPTTQSWALAAVDRGPFNTGASDPNYIYGSSVNPAWAGYYDWWQMDYGPSSMTTTPLYNGTATYPAVTDGSIYDWRNINILSMNFGKQKNTNYNIELEQDIIPGLLSFSAGWFRQDYDGMSHYNVGSLNATTLFVDTNVYNSDGTPNPYLGRPYVRDETPDRIMESVTVDQYRGMLAFTPDFTKNNNWTKWLGRHQIMGLASSMRYEQTALRKRLGFAYSDDMEGRYRYTTNPNVAGWKIQSNSTFRRYFYLDAGGAQAGNGSVTRSPGWVDDDPVSGSVVVYDYANNKFKEIGMTAVWNVDDRGTAKSARKLDSYSAGWTGYLWQDRIVATAGIRRDINSTRGTQTPTAASYFIDGEYQYDQAFKLWNNWSKLDGTTKTYGAVVKPFMNWEYISRRSANNLFWEFVENFGFSFNRSDNFDAPTATNVDPFGNVLPKPVGTGKDYGVQVTLFKNKLYARVNWFESDNQNTPYQGALDRLVNHIDTTAYRGWLEHIYMLNDGADPSTADWTNPYTTGATGANTTKINAMKAWVGDRWVTDMPKSAAGAKGYDYYNTSNLGGSVRGTTATQAKGVELTVNYNPLPNWTIKLTATKVKTSNADTVKEINAWMAVRTAVWDNAKASTYLNSTGIATITRLGGVAAADGSGYSGYQISTNASSDKKGKITTFWDSTNYRAATGGSTINSDSADGWTTPRGYYNAVFGSQYALQQDMDGQQVMGQRKHSFSLLTNYTFDHGALKGFAIGGGQRWADKAVIGFWGKDTTVDTDTLYDASDVTRPIYDKAMWYTDLWVSYTRKIFNDKVRMKLQINIADVFQDGELQPVAADKIGRYYAYRIVDPRTFTFTASFDF